MKKLRFAPLVRVSTEEMEKRGDSIKIQKTIIVDSAKKMGGAFIQDRWRYSGQEHSTPEYEREKLDQLLDDASKGLFDAVIVMDIIRWSRDNEKSKQGLRILKKNKIRLFAGTFEFNLYNPDHLHMIGSQVETGEHQALRMAKASIDGKVHKAKQGIPVGTLPTGRRYDRKKLKWLKNDPAMVDKIKRAVKLLLDDGLSLNEIGKIVGMNVANLRETLLNRCGDHFYQELKSENFDIYERIKIPMPRILPDETIAKVRERLELNKTIYHGLRGKNQYLLSSMILCSNCREPLFGARDRNHLYYRHSKRGCDTFKSIRADLIEETVINHIIKVHGTEKYLKEAIEAVLPKKDERKQLEKELKSLNKELKKTANKINNLMGAVENGVFDPDDVKSRMVRLRENRDTLISEIKIAEERISQIPTKTAIDSKVRLLKRLLKGKLKYSKDFDSRRSLLQTIFSGKIPDGSRPGIYLEKADDGKYSWKYSIKGIIQESGFVPKDAKVDILPICRTPLRQ